MRFSGLRGRLLGRGWERCRGEWSRGRGLRARGGSGGGERGRGLGDRRRWCRSSGEYRVVGISSAGCTTYVTSRWYRDEAREEGNGIAEQVVDGATRAAACESVLYRRSDDRPSSCWGGFPWSQYIVCTTCIYEVMKTLMY